MPKLDTEVNISCSFCGKSHREVRKLIAGPTVYICDECVKLCNTIFAKETVREPKFRAPERTEMQPDSPTALQELAVDARYLAKMLDRTREAPATLKRIAASLLGQLESLTEPLATQAQAFTRREGVVACSFCGRARTEVTALIAGPTVYVCYECVGLCNDIIAEEISKEHRSERASWAEPADSTNVDLTRAAMEAYRLSVVIQRHQRVPLSVKRAAEVLATELRPWLPWRPRRRGQDQA